MIVVSDHCELDGLRKLNPQVISAVYDRHFPVIYRFTLYRLGDETVAEDITSDVFVCLLEALRDDRGPRSNLKAWLLATASHIVNDHLRRMYRRPTVSLPETLTDPNHAPVDEYDKRELHQSLHDILAQLTPEQQNVLALRFGQGYSIEDTASLMKKNINAVKALQYRALATLHRKIGRGGA